MIAILWRYRVKPEAREAFESAYSSSGSWAKLFGRSAYYLGTELLRGEAGTYLTIDRWRSESDFHAFLALHRADYEALDRAAEGWTLEERNIGLWQCVAPE